MTPDLMIQTINQVSDHVQVNGNMVQFVFYNVTIVLIFDANADRMRLIAPIIEVDKLEENMLMQAMEANFHSALDARYAISNGMVWSAFVHPMSELSDAFFRIAINQVAVAHLTFGEQYTSSALVFGGSEGAS